MSTGQGSSISRRSFILFLPALLAYSSSGCLLRQRRRHKRPVARNSVERLIIRESRRQGVDPALIKAIVWKESRFRPSVRGSAGEWGLMQILSPAVTDWKRAHGIRRFNMRQLRNPEVNLRVGIWYFKTQLDAFKSYRQATAIALAAYNAGAGNVKRWLGSRNPRSVDAWLRRIKKPGTRDYVKATMERYQLYKRDFNFDS